MVIALIIKGILAPLIILLLYSNSKALQNQEQQVRNFWENIFGEVYQIRKQTFVKNSAFKPEYNQSRYNVAESPVYCKKSDSYKMVHPDIVLQDYYVWRDYPPTNLPKKITLDKTYAVLDKVSPSKTASYKYENQLPLQLGFIYTTVSSLYNNYVWGKGLGCVLQKYSHIPGKSSVAMKNQLIDNFMKYIRDFEKKNITNPECKRNASFIPETYRLNDEDDCKAFFETFKTDDYQKKFKKYGPQYILKTNQHRGEGITVLFEKETKDILEEYNYGQECGNISKQVIAQRYISNPFLYKGHKIEFRIYYTIISTKPVIAYSYSRALIKRCAKPFSVHSTEKGAHVCNTAIVKNLVKTDKDDQEIEDEEFFIDWYLEGLEDLLIKQGRAKKGWLQSYLYPKIHRSLIHMTKATYHSFARDSTFGEFFAVDFLLDDNLDVWVLEVNYNPQILSVTPDRIKRNYKMLEDHFELQYAYIKSKLYRLSQFGKTLMKNNTKSILNQSKQVEELLRDKLESQFELSKENLYVKIMDEGQPGTQAYTNLISKECLK
ncbi:unnamed protein product [Paramecium pentaurelia]|uniref:Tubulin-tyrosine ligase family protein n=1 Tax=Paramecium pentaurelia TaxID=43138 RepID=A0A8S1TWR3_9CILI|nr:unnamed protein product [Paramecium pentaurelia]